MSPAPSAQPSDLPVTPPARSLWSTAITLGSGSAIGYLIGAASAPVLARLYQPAAFGGYAIWAAVASIVGAIGTFRLELLIIGDSTDRDAAASLVAGTIASFTAGLVLWLALAIGGPRDDVLTYALTGLLAVSNALVALTAAVALRHSLIGSSARARAIRAAGTIAGSLALGLIAPTQVAILAANFLGSIASAAYLARAAIGSGTWKALATTKLDDLRPFIRSTTQNRRAALFASAISNASSQAPILIVGALGGAAAAGTFGLVRRAVGTATSWIGGAVADSLKARLTSEQLTGSEVLSAYRQAFKPLAIGAIALCIGLEVAPDRALTAVLGSGWADTGSTLRSLAPWLSLALVASPLSVVLIVRRRFGIDLAWQAFNLVAISAGAAIGWAAGQQRGMLVGLGAGGTVAYVAYLLASYHVARSAANGPATARSAPKPH